MGWSVPCVLFHLIETVSLRAPSLKHLSNSLLSTQFTFLGLSFLLKSHVWCFFTKCINNLGNLIEVYELKKILQHHYMWDLQPKSDPSIISEHLSARWNSQMSYFHNFVIFLEHQVTKNDPARKYVSFLKHVTSNCSPPQSVLDSPYERFLLGSVWNQTMKNRSIEIGAWWLCSWWHHEG